MNAFRAGSWLRVLAYGALGVLSIACSASPGINVGNEVDGSVAGSSGASGSGGSGGLGGFGGGNSNALIAHIEEPPSTMAIEIVTISCADECADVIAVASGGNPDYTFSWNDGVTTAERTVCPSATSTFTVTVTDTAILDGEFPYAGQTTTASVTADVLDCERDGGVDASGPTDDFCIENPSMEGTPGVAEITGFMLPGWSMCVLSPNVEPGGGGSTIAASDGATYLGALDATQDLLNESAGTSFCAPLQPGRALSFTVDIATTAFNHGPVKLELWGGAASCGKQELLWTSPVIDNVDSWRTYCATITPSQAHTHLTTWPVLETTTASYIIIDNFRPVAACPTN